MQTEPQLEPATSAGVILPETGQFLFCQQLQRCRRTRARVSLFFICFTSVLRKQFSANDTFLREANSYKRALALRNSWLISPIPWCLALSDRNSGSCIRCAPDKISSPLMNMSYELEYFYNGPSLMPITTTRQQQVIMSNDILITGRNKFFYIFFLWQKTLLILLAQFLRHWRNNHHQLWEYFV